MKKVESISFENSLIFAMKHQQTAPVRIELSQAEEYNKQKYGIFWTVNGFKGRRIKECLTNCQAWAIDMDEGTKQKQHKRIMRAPLIPSLIVESKRGYQVYWYAENATAENYKNITEKRLVPYFGADMRAKDICRILRMPNFYHWKDKDDPFLVKVVYEQSIKYDEDFMLKMFPVEKERKFTHSFDNSGFNENEEALMKLSGAVELNGEEFSLKENSNRTKQICVNGERTSSWIDKEGYIGSYERGGKTIANWIMWYNYSFKEATEICKKYGIRI